MARRDDRAYWAYVREEQRRQPGCPARELCDASRSRGLGERRLHTRDEISVSPAAEEDELHATERCGTRVVAQNGDHETRAVRNRKAADACAEGRERETLKLLGGRYFERRTRR